MVRPRKLRRVTFLPGVTYFKPQGIPMRLLEEVHLSVDELEALRLKDLEGLEQEDAAQKMGISRQTFQRVLEDAHRKATEGLVRGNALRIKGGDYELGPIRFHCRRCGHRWEQMLANGTPIPCPSCEEELPETALPPSTRAGGRERHRHGQIGHLENKRLGHNRLGAGD